jgi:ferredoxin
VKVTVDRERCASAGMCALTAPEVFDQDEDDGRVVLLDPAPPQARHSVVRDAATLCPSQAIRLAGQP